MVVSHFSFLISWQLKRIRSNYFNLWFIVRNLISRSLSNVFYLMSYLHLPTKLSPTFTVNTGKHFVKIIKMYFSSVIISANWMLCLWDSAFFGLFPLRSHKISSLSVRTWWDEVQIQPPKVTTWTSERSSYQKPKHPHPPKKEKQTNNHNKTP